MPNYGDQKYWEERYKEQEGTTYDWLENYEEIQPLIQELNIPKTAMVLNVGCGNSEFSEKMYDDGYKNNYNIDFCKNVIKDMKEHTKDRKGMVFEQMDVKNMTYKDEMFDLIIDKSTIDSLLCGESSFMNVATMTKEISRVLKTGGYYVIISYGSPEDRMPHLEREHLGFEINIYTIKQQAGEDGEGNQKPHYVYICKKLENANENLKNYDLVYKDLEQEELEYEDEEEEGEDQKDEEQ